MRIDLRVPYDASSIDRTQKGNVRSISPHRQEAVADPSNDVHLSQLESTISAAPDIREDRVQQVRQAITSGTYSVSDEQLAQAMLKDILRR